jgi:glutamyl-tRNA synthetase
MASEASVTARPVRVRIAPSPTGDPHVGTAYIALFNYVFARQSGGAFVLRIEDTDQTRSRADSEAQIMTALRWLGLRWDEGPDVGGPHGPYRQSERQAIYAEHAQKLLDNGSAYRCFCTPERLAELRKQQMAAKQTPGYDRHCRSIDAAESARRAGQGEVFTVRLAVPLEGSIEFDDRLGGHRKFAVTQIDDQVLLKSDGFPKEWVSSTPKHVLLYRGFGWEPPEWIHMPLLRNQDGSKISKRKHPVSINFYRDAGILPAALLNFLALMGWSFGGDREKFNLDEMTEVFSWDKVSRGAPVFNMDKLRWLNEQYIHELDYAQLAAALIDWRLGADSLARLMPLVRERIKQLSDFIPATEYFFSLELDYAPLAAELKVPDVTGKDLAAAIGELLESYDALPSFNAAGLEQASRALCDARGWKAKHVFMLLRLGVTGRKASPPLFDTMEVLGKELCRYRLRRLAEFVRQRT